MKKRLRKKLGRGEFSNHGFEYQYQLLPGFNRGLNIVHFSTEEFNVLNHLGLYNRSRFTGDRCKGFINCYRRFGRGLVMEQQRRAFGRWLGTHPEVISSTVGPLQDAVAYLSAANDLPVHGPGDTIRLYG